MADIRVQIPDAWIDEDDNLYVVVGNSLVPSVFKKANTVLAEWGDAYAITMGWHNITPPYPSIWVDPVWIAHEAWPEDAASRAEVQDWVKVWKIDLQPLIPDTEDRP